MFVVKILDKGSWNIWRSFSDFNQAFSESCAFIAATKHLSADILHEQRVVCVIPREGAEILQRWVEGQLDA